MTEDMTRDDLHEQVLNTVSYWGGVGVGVDSVELTEEIMAIVDAYAGVQRRTSLRWAADEIRQAADIDEHIHRVRGEAS